MLRIECICCGVRDEEEFTFGGAAHISRPDSSCAAAEWADYLFNRGNPKGVHYERWCHTFGCGRWFNVARDTMTHEVLAVYAMGQPEPDLNVRDAAPLAEVTASLPGTMTAASGKRGRQYRLRFARQGAEP